jgi:hypothetical protein
MPRFEGSAPSSYTAYSDDSDDNKLSVGVPVPLSNGISNIRFYSVPEPIALLLVGAGLVAARAVRLVAAPSSLVSR